jgi:hypothetical protein
MLLEFVWLCVVVVGMIMVVALVAIVVHFEVVMMSAGISIMGA